MCVFLRLGLILHAGQGTTLPYIRFMHYEVHTISMNFIYAVDNCKEKVNLGLAVHDRRSFMPRTSIPVRPGTARGPPSRRGRGEILSASGSSLF